MSHHTPEKKENILNLYLLVGAGAGFFVGLLLDLGINAIIGGVVTGLLFAAFFYNALVKGRADA
ncbi:hypothetical protein [Mucilaginibacter myungsuensis]|uniref:Uncharacterized protein n=1 Tax=Mucilaginibacter myungsuensis TaxID=649104 RepID=A0A929KYL2_9SPHI|nr:hypothetical protein [Mucilaginibacter myungsuensis]MBE9661274.1 hypothetical protein [Mucilaginibacter myungsuensis]MDN3597417.1 hypothetical protein [Mucilaginibacter myungsuensis]